MIGIIGAMDEEVLLLKGMLRECELRLCAGIEFYTGLLAGQKVCLVRSGIGKVNAAMATTLLIEFYSPKYIINTGCAGGTKNFLSVGDLVISSNVVHHDADNSCFGYKVGQIPREPEHYAASAELIEKCSAILKEQGKVSHVGQIASGDSFMYNVEKINQVKALLPEVFALDMEAAGIAQVAHKYQVPFVIARALSDIAGKESVDYRQFLPQAVSLSSTLVLALVPRLA